MTDKAAQAHLAAIQSGTVTKTNVIGIRKGLNAWVKAWAWGGSWSRSPHYSDTTANALVTEVRKHMPKVQGELHNTGLAVLRSPRYRSRWTPFEADVIASLDCFRLVDFGEVGRCCFTPHYRAEKADGQGFTFRNIPWQSGGNGPEVID